MKLIEVNGEAKQFGVTQEEVTLIANHIQEFLVSVGYQVRPTIPALMQLVNAGTQKLMDDGWCMECRVYHDHDKVEKKPDLKVVRDDNKTETH